MWSSRPSNPGPPPPLPTSHHNSRVTSAASKSKAGNSSSQHQQNVQRVEVTTDDYGLSAEKKKRGQRAPEAIDAYVYETGVGGMKQVYASAESHKASTFQGSALPTTEL